ncbi:MAG: hypothetical protein PHY05_12785 [Methanothrix sp.]|nr:hypothetical protein [Methanothrix sp.]
MLWVATTTAPKRGSAALSCGWRGVQPMQRHCPTAGTRPSTITSEPRGMSGSGGSGSAGVMGERTAIYCGRTLREILWLWHYYYLNFPEQDIKPMFQLRGFAASCLRVKQKPED